MSVGKYVVYRENHFMGLEVWGDGTFILRPTCRTHIGAVRDWHVAAAEPYAAIFQLGSTREGEIIMSEDCKGGAQEEDTTVWCTRSSNVDGSLPRCETLKFRSTVEFRSPGTGRLDIVSRGEDDSITFHQCREMWSQAFRQVLSMMAASQH